MTAWHIRDLTEQDLEEAVALEGLSGSVGRRPIFPLSDVVASLLGGEPAVAAEASGRLVGTAAGRIEHDRGWILRITLHPEWRHLGLGSALLAALEQKLVTQGARRLVSALPRDETGTQALRNSGFVEYPDIVWFEKVESLRAHDVDVAIQLGGYVPPSDLWQQVEGMRNEKEIIERRLVLPLAQPAVATEHGVREPRTVMLFGPPGTGKTTFAKAIASRLGWPFVELFPSRMHEQSGGLASGISTSFRAATDMDSVLVFIDEVEEIAASRQAAAGSDVGVVNELLKSIVSFRERPHRLLVCATNGIASLDAAFLRHGRFDFVMPIGPPDEQARYSMWMRAAQDANAAQVDLDALVAASNWFTPADIGHAAQLVAHRTFEATLSEGQRVRATTADYLEAIGNTRPTLQEADVAEFRREIAEYERV